MHAFVVALDASQAALARETALVRWVGPLSPRQKVHGALGVLLRDAALERSPDLLSTSVSLCLCTAIKHGNRWILLI